MKEQKIIGGGIAVLVVALAAGGVWWFTQSAPVAPNAAPTQSAASPGAAPGPDQAALKSIIQDMTRLIKDGDMVTVQKTYRPPDKVAQLTAQDQATLEQLAQGSPETFVLLAQELDAIKDQTPTYDAAGDKATYLASKPADMQGNTNQRPITFIKVNGQWYLDSTASPDFWILF